MILTCILVVAVVVWIRTGSSYEKKMKMNYITTVNALELGLFCTGLSWIFHNALQWIQKKAVNIGTHGCCNHIFFNYLANSCFLIHIGKKLWPQIVNDITKARMIETPPQLYGILNPYSSMYDPLFVKIRPTLTEQWVVKAKWKRPESVNVKPKFGIYWQAYGYHDWPCDHCPCDRNAQDWDDFTIDIRTRTVRGAIYYSKAVKNRDKNKTRSRSTPNHNFQGRHIISEDRKTTAICSVGEDLAESHFSQWNREAIILKMTTKTIFACHLLAVWIMLSVLMIIINIHYCQHFFIFITE